MYDIGYTIYYKRYTIYYIEDTNLKCHIFFSKFHLWRGQDRPKIAPREPKMVLPPHGLGWYNTPRSIFELLGVIFGVSWALDSPKTAPTQPKMTKFLKNPSLFNDFGRGRRVYAFFFVFCVCVCLCVCVSVCLCRSITQYFFIFELKIAPR